MAAMRSTSSTAAPLPPPIATGKGSRSAAVNDELLSEYLQKLLQVPDLKLPNSHSPASSRQSFPATINYGSLVSRSCDSVNKLLRSVSEFGVFRIGGHGIPAAELGSMAAEAEWLFQGSGEIGNRKEFVWLRSENERLGWARDVTETQKYRAFSKKMESVANKLDELAKELGQIFSEHLSKRIQNKVEERESVLSLHKYNCDNFIDLNPPLLNNDDIKSRDHALSLRVPLKQCEYYVQSWRGLLSFDVSPDTIVVDVRQQLEDWSQGEFKSVSGEFIFESGLHGSQATFSLELKCSPSSLNHGFSVNNKTISIPNQILIVLIIIFLYKFFMFIYV